MGSNRSTLENIIFLFNIIQVYLKIIYDNPIYYHSLIFFMYYFLISSFDIWTCLGFTGGLTAQVLCTQPNLKFAIAGMKIYIIEICFLFFVLIFFYFICLLLMVILLFYRT
jgi:hypothetical protein